MNESEQAQAIAEIKERCRLARNAYGSHLLHSILDDCDKALKIVDSKAQKITDLNRVGSNTLLALIEAQETIAEQTDAIRRHVNAANYLQNEISEQAKEIERLTVMCKQEDAQIIALVKERDEARTVADEWREKAGSKYDRHPWEKQ